MWLSNFLIKLVRVGHLKRNLSNSLNQLKNNIKVILEIFRASTPITGTECKMWGTGGGVEWFQRKGHWYLQDLDAHMLTVFSVTVFGGGAYNN